MPILKEPRAQLTHVWASQRPSQSGKWSPEAQYKCPFVIYMTSKILYCFLKKSSGVSIAKESTQADNLNFIFKLNCATFAPLVVTYFFMCFLSVCIWISLIAITLPHDMFWRITIKSLGIIRYYPNNNVWAKHTHANHALILTFFFFFKLYRMFNINPVIPNKLICGIDCSFRIYWNRMSV